MVVKLVNAFLLVTWGAVDMNEGSEVMAKDVHNRHCWTVLLGVEGHRQRLKGLFGLLI